MTMRHGGIIFVIIGTILLAFAIENENKYTLSARSKKDKKRMKKLVESAEDGSFVEPSVVKINKKYFWGGLACVAIGSLMQW